MERLIKHTQHVAQHPWPEDVYLQGGGHGLVFSNDGNDYITAFVEAFPGQTFLRGEGKTVAEAEDSAWKQYLRYRNCDGNLKFGEWHGPYERRQYRNGAGFCTRCGIWMNKVFEPLPEDPNRKPSRLEKFLQAVVKGDNEIQPEEPGQ
jgi:hypothetical protein